MIKSLPGYFLIFIIKIYKLILSPLFPLSCRHYPSCSEYSIGAVKKFGVFKGGYLSVVRIMKCNPFFKGGYDPIP